MIFGLGLSKIMMAVTAASIMALAILGYLYKNSLKEVAYLESTVASYKSTVEALQDWNKKRDWKSKTRINSC